MSSKRTTSIDDVIERRRRERDADGDRFVDLRIDFELAGETLLSLGGRWDRRLGDFDQEAEAGVVVELHPGQRRAVEWFRTWLAAHAGRRDLPPRFDANELEAFELDVDPAHVYSALFAGGRRGGKTWIAVALAAAYALAFPGAIVWIASPSDQKHDEVRRYAGNVLAASWLEAETVDGWHFINGSVLLLKSAYIEEGLKEGKANLIVLNEGQMMKSRAYTVARGAIVDSSGLVLVCANPPVEAKDQTWVSDFAADAAAGRRASVFLEFNPLDNPHIDRRALLSMRAEVDERTFAIEVLGQFRGPKDAVAWNWARLENEIPVRPGLVDVTAAFLSMCGEGEGIERILGLDVQRIPYIGGPVYKFFVEPNARISSDSVLAWIVGEVVLDGGDEVDYCHEAREKGYAPEDSLIICDATAEYQHSRRRDADVKPPEWTGRGSFDIIRGEGFRRIKPPSRIMRRKNPPIADRMRAFTSMICSGVGRRRLFADPDLAPRTCIAIREWRTVHGAPSRTSDHAHLGDGASYPIVRLFPRVLRSGNPGSVDPISERVDKAAAPAAAPARILPPTRGPSQGRRGDRVRGW